MGIHKAPSRLAGKTVMIKSSVSVHGGKEFEVRDWWDRCHGYSWMLALSNPICTIYAIRCGFSGRAEMLKNEVLYGKIGQCMYLFHVSELEDEDPALAAQHRVYRPMQPDMHGRQTGHHPGSGPCDKLHPDWLSMASSPTDERESIPCCMEVCL